jgi:hypothetical protein
MSRLPEDEFKDVIAELRRTAPEPPPVHWGAYRAELRETLERGARGGWGGWSRLLRPFQMAVAAVSSRACLYRPAGPPPVPDPATMDNAFLSSHLDVIAHLDVVQRLDLLEDFDIIERLDSLPPRGEG